MKFDRIKLMDPQEEQPFPWLKEACCFCFDVLQQNLHAPRSSEPLPSASIPAAEYPLFVTWDVVEGGRKKLRGNVSQRGNSEMEKQDA